jgi:branched-chain amino acid transport system ATP-binding protein
MDTGMLKIDKIAVAYGAIDALHGVSLEVGQGEVVALLGANGAGKTTLLRTISGLHRAKSGAIRFEGELLANSSAESRVKRGLAHVPEGRRIFPGLTVRENLDVATTVWRRRGMSADGDLDTVFALFPRLKERAAQLGWSLSGGEQQMLAIGRALMARPKMLLLDEPSLGLAPRLSAEVYERIAEINARGVTVLLVEQNTVLALEVARRAYVIENGQIVLEGPARDLARHPRVREAYLGA